MPPWQFSTAQVIRLNPPSKFYTRISGTTSLPPRPTWMSDPGEHPPGQLPWRVPIKALPKGLSLGARHAVSAALAITGTYAHQDRVHDRV